MKKENLIANAYSLQKTSLINIECSSLVNVYFVSVSINYGLSSCITLGNS